MTKRNHHSWNNVTQFLNHCVLEPCNVLVELKVNSGTSWMSFKLSSSLHQDLYPFKEKKHSLLFTSLTDDLPQLFVTIPLMNGYSESLLTFVNWGSLVVSVLSFSSLIDKPKFNYALNFTAFLGLLLNIKATVVLILFPSTLGYLVIYLTLFFRNTKCL